MTGSKTKTTTKDRDLILTRLIDAPPARVYDAWTEPELLKLWFAPLPWTTPLVECDVRAGGTTSIVMRAPDGTDYPYQGVYLEVIRHQRLVFTNAYRKAWEPSAKPFTTVILSFEPHAGMTKYPALVRHLPVEDREAHEKMGFHQGWVICAEQMAALLEPAAAAP